MNNVNIKEPINLADYLYAPDAGIYPGTGEDLTPKLNALLNDSSTSKKGIYFPEGVYLFAEDVFMKSYRSFQGSVNGTVFRGVAENGEAVMFGDDVYEHTVTDLKIENIIFDNARVHFYGRKINIQVSHNIFINTASNTAQLTCSTNAYSITGNVFMRGRGFAGVGLNTYGNAPGLLIEQNFLGSVNDIPQAAPWLDETTRQMLDTLLALRAGGSMSFDDAQGDFVAGWYSTSNLRKGIFRKNFFSGSEETYLYNPKTGAADIPRDHNIYIKQYDRVEVVQNYFAGWPGKDQPSGQLKFRNAKGLVFAANYLKGISFNARPYDDISEQWLIMKDTFIFNNYLDDGMISYWQNFTDSQNKRIDITNYLVFSNDFIHRDSAEVLITAPANTLSPDQFLCAENRFVDTGALVNTSRLFTETELDALQAGLPDYASKYLNVSPIVNVK